MIPSIIIAIVIIIITIIHSQVYFYFDSFFIPFFDSIFNSVFIINIQVYVALSRVKTFDGLWLDRKMTKKSVCANKDALNFYGY